jgi:transcriptional regulator with XRE-family HTH domain
MGDLIRFPQPEVPPAGDRPAPLWREAVGRELREARLGQDRTLADVAGDAGVSTQYLSEVERGRKEPSSEVIEAVGGALGLTLVDLTARVTRRLVGSRTSRPQGPLALAA